MLVAGQVVMAHKPNVLRTDVLCTSMVQVPYVNDVPKKAVTLIIWGSVAPPDAITAVNADAPGDVAPPAVVVCTS